MMFSRNEEERGEHTGLDICVDDAGLVPSSQDAEDLADHDSESLKLHMRRPTRTYIEGSEFVLEEDLEKVLVHEGDDLEDVAVNVEPGKNLGNALATQ